MDIRYLKFASIQWYLKDDGMAKSAVNLKNANDRRNARDNVQGMETNDEIFEVPSMELEPSLENTPVEIFKDDSFDEYNY